MGTGGGIARKCLFFASVRLDSEREVLSSAESQEGSKGEKSLLKKSFEEPGFAKGGGKGEKGESRETVGFEHVIELVRGERTRRRH